MKHIQPAGYREIEHTADWELEVWASDLPALLEQAARGMYQLAAIRLRAGPRIERYLEIQALDRESMLVDFLSELLYLDESEGLAFDRYTLRIEGNTLHADLEGAPLETQSKEIKAVTYHDLQIRDAERGLEVFIVFDV